MMPPARFRALSTALAVVLMTLAGPDRSVAQTPATLDADDYGQWERLGSGELSPDGRWLAVSISRVNDEDELRIHRTDEDSVVVVPYGSAPTFSEDGRWLLYTIGRSEEERDEAREAERPVRDDVGILDLRNGTVRVREGVASFALSADGRYAALQRYRAEDQEHAGADLLVEELGTGERMVFGNVSDVAWADRGHLLAMTLDAADRVGNGISLYDPASGALRPLDQAEATYREMSWREDAADLAVLRTVEDSAFADTAHVVLAWRGLDGASPSRFALGDDGGVQPTEGMRVVQYRAPEWSDDGRVVFVGVQERVPAPEPCEEPGPTEDEGEREGGGADANGAPCEDDEERPGVEIWHTRDVDPVPRQRVREEQLRQRNHSSAWHLDRGAFVQLGDELTERTELAEGGQPRDRHGRDAVRRARDVPAAVLRPVRDRRRER
ncbi:MAG: hypothetical protein U5R14_00510 [Gemmatimonadota bacterium]|nr:hypothetical protein [Gemmatimonadota bacterium]